MKNYTNNNTKKLLRAKNNRINAVCEGLKMRRISLEITPKMLIGLLLAVIVLPGFAMAQELDLYYDDPTGDVEDWDEYIYSSGYEYIDIIEVSSSENVLGTQLVLEMTVTGVITDSNNISYMFYLMDNDEWIYIVSYTNGICEGYNMDTGDTDILTASGAGTSTLEIRVPLNYLGDITDFDFWSEAVEYDDDNFFTDYAPDTGPGWGNGDYYYETPLLITEPKDGGTVSGTKTIMGYTDPYYGIESVEIQIDSQSSGGWLLTSTNDNWEHWSYDWQSIGVSDGTHTIYARGTDGVEYYTDSITVHVDQNNAVSPRTTDMPTIDVGLQLNYEMFMPMFDYGDIFGDIDMTFDAEMTMFVEKKESIEVNGTQYDSFAVNMSMDMEMTMTFEGDTMSSTITGSGTQWMRESDLAVIKNDLTMETSYSMMGMSDSSIQRTITTHNPPQDGYNFPISVAESWTSVSTAYTESFSSFYGFEEWYNESFETTMAFEALRVEDVSVPAGTYETFIIWSKDVSDWYSSGGGMPFLGSSGTGYSLDYYAPELGFPVKTEVYNETRGLEMSMELVSIERGVTPHTASPAGHGWELSPWLLLIPLIIIILLTAVLVNRRKKRMAAAQESWQAYSDGSEVPGGTTQAYPQQGGQPYVVQERHFYANNIPQSQVQTTGAYSAQASKPQAAYIPPPRYVQQQASHQTSQAQPEAAYTSQSTRTLPPPPPKVQSQVIYPHKPKPSTAPPPPTTVTPVAPLMHIRCPKCSNIFSVQKGTETVQCPKCQTKGKLG
jgi:hypothetical protein